jgi:hypothetical protein
MEEEHYRADVLDITFDVTETTLEETVKRAVRQSRTDGAQRYRSAGAVRPQHREKPSAGAGADGGGRDPDPSGR